MGKILICDDSTFTLQRHKKLFEAVGNEVITAQGGSKAYPLLDSGEKFDLVVLDLLMPDEDGVTVLKNIKEKHPNQNVIIASADIQEKRRDEVLSAGALDLVNKPLDESKVKLIMAKVGFTQQ